MFYVIDYLYIVLVLPCVLFALWAQFNVKTTFAKYSKVSLGGMTGFDSARRILDANGLYTIRIARVSGELTDHFNPQDNTIYLSDSVYDNSTAAAVGVAAHEAVPADCPDVAGLHEGSLLQSGGQVKVVIGDVLFVFGTEELVEFTGIKAKEREVKGLILQVG